MQIKRVMAALLMVCLAAASCQSTDSSTEAEVSESAPVTESAVATEQTVAPTTSTTAAAPTIENQATVTLIEQGSEPRSELRFTFEDGQSEVFVTEQSQNLVQTLGGEPLQSVQTAVVTRTQVDIETVDDGYRVNAVVLSSEPGANMDPAIVTQVAAALEATVGLTTTVIMNDQGVVTDSEVSGSEGLDATGNELVESLSQLSTPLPNEAVGVGAVWEVTQVVPFQGLNAVQTTTYRITDISESIISLETETVQTSRKAEPLSRVASPSR